MSEGIISILTKSKKIIDNQNKGRSAIGEEKEALQRYIRKFKETEQSLTKLKNNIPLVFGDEGYHFTVDEENNDKVIEYLYSNLLHYRRQIDSLYRKLSGEQLSISYPDAK